jgi:16S rRNA (guanine527-N7)-methyltransferase
MHLMPYTDDGSRIEQRAALAGVRVSAEQAAGLAGYLAVLRKWNQKSNLTAFELNPPSDAAIDRLIVEPIVASGRLLQDDRLLIDIGSGGGSPAIPLRLMAPQLRVVLVEARTRKAAFLREVVRQLELDGSEVENRRFEELAGRSELQGEADVLTMRAVRVGPSFWVNTRNMLRPSGRLLLLGTEADLEALALPPNMEKLFSEPLLTSNRSHLIGLRRKD